MNRRSRRYTDREISVVLDSISETDADQNTMRRDKGKRQVKKIDRYSPSIEDEKQSGSVDRSPMSRKNIRIRLRRSTEQSMYKIAANSDQDSPVRKERGSVRRHGESNNKSNIGIKEHSSPANYVKQATESSNVKTRRLSSLDDPLKSRPSLRNRERINYNEDHLQSTVQVLTPGQRIRTRSQSRYSSTFDESNNEKHMKNLAKVPEKENEPLVEISSSPEREIPVTRKTSSRKRELQETGGANGTKNEPVTPKSVRVSVKHSALTPSMGSRMSALAKPATPLQEARSRLHVSVVPKCLPCREEEFNNIFTFLKGKLMDNSGGCIYISGVPGTGKTATVNEVVRCLERLVMKGQIDNFNFIDINGLKLSEPRQAYVQILKRLTGETLAWSQAYQVLDGMFNGKKSQRPMTLLMVDELDLLCTKRQDVVYNLLDWPTKMNARLVVITIANTMDLPERVLMGRVTSRLGLTRLTFQPYDHKQLQEIVLTRLKDTNSFRSEAVQLVARKVSAVSGDARRALDICRRATEIAESRGGASVSMQDVNQALSEMIATAKVQAIKHCSKVEQVFLQAVSVEIARTGVEETTLKNVINQIESLCSFDGVKVPTVTEIVGICGRLGASRLLICEHSRTDLYQRILLNVSSDDIHYALQKTDLVDQS